MSRWILDDKLILMGGAGSGIGAATTRLRAQRGARLVAAGLDGSTVSAAVLARGPGRSSKR